MGWHIGYGDWKSFEELVASWQWLFGYEAALVCIYLIWICGPPVVMNDETLDFWRRGKLML